MHLFICFFVMDFFRKMGAHLGFGIGPLIPFSAQKLTSCQIRLLTINKINDDFKRGCVTGDHSFKNGCFQIEIQYLTTALGRFPCSSVVMVLAFNPGLPGLKSSPDLMCLQCIYSFFSLFRFLFVRRYLLETWSICSLPKEQLMPSWITLSTFLQELCLVLS